MALPELIAQMSEELKHNFEKRARLISHPGESGEAREAALRQILETYLPGRCGVDTGFVVDSDWTVSKQIDVVIYDRNYTPVFEIVDGKRYFPCETVIAVGEVKSSIDRHELEDSFDKIESVKSLDRFGVPRITGPGEFQISTLEQDNYRDQIFGFIFTSDSLKLENLISTYKEELKKRDRYLWPNYYCDYNNVNIGYYGPASEGQEPGANTQNMAAQGITVVDESEILFGLFHSLLMQFTTLSHIGEPSLLEYYNLETGVDVDIFRFAENG